MTTVTMTMTAQQARCVIDALDLYCRIGLGQIEELEMLARSGFIRPTAGTDPADVRDELAALCSSIKRMLGHHPGGSFGIGHDLVHEYANRAFEIKKQIEKPLAEHRNTNPKLRTVDYDGRIVAYTSDPNITVTVEETE